MKFIKKGFIRYLSLLFVLVLASCGSTEPINSDSTNTSNDTPATSIDNTKKQVYVSIYNGGHGTSFLDDIIRDFNEEVALDQGYQVVMIPEKKNLSVIAAELPTNMTQVYLTADSNFIAPIYQNHLADLSDILNSDVDGNGKNN